MATTIARTSATVGQGATSNLQGFEAHHPSTYMRGGDSMVRIALAIKREVEGAQSIRDTGASGKRFGKEAEDFYSSRISRTGSWLSGPSPDQGFYPAKTNDMLFLPSPWTYEAGFPSEARIPGFWDSTVPVISGTDVDTVYSFSPQCGPEEPA